MSLIDPNRFKASLNASSFNTTSRHVIYIVDFYIVEKKLKVILRGNVRTMIRNSNSKLKMNLGMRQTSIDWCSAGGWMMSSLDDWWLSDENFGIFSTWSQNIIFLPYLLQFDQSDCLVGGSLFLIYNRLTTYKTYRIPNQFLCVSFWRTTTANRQFCACAIL